MGSQNDKRSLVIGYVQSANEGTACFLDQNLLDYLPSYTLRLDTLHMAYIVINGNKIPMVNVSYHYTKNGSFKRRASLVDARISAHEDGDGTGNVWTLDEYQLEMERTSIAARVFTRANPAEGRAFKGKALIRRLGLENGCRHEKTTSILNPHQPSYWYSTELVSCVDCLNLVERIIRKDQNGTMIVLDRFEGHDYNYAELLTAVERPLTFEDSEAYLYIDGVLAEAALVYECFAAATENLDEKPAVFKTEAEAENHALTLGDGRLEYMRSRLYQHVSPELSYEVELTEIIFVGGETSPEVSARYAALQAPLDCIHEEIVLKSDTTCDHEGEDIAEYTEKVCKSCTWSFDRRYHFDNYQPELSKKLLEYNATQQACSHEATVLKPTPENLFYEIAVDSSVSVYCAHCDAYLWTKGEPEERTLLFWAEAVSASFVS